jgi:hypothetical protein
MNTIQKGIFGIRKNKYETNNYHYFNFSIFLQGEY